MTRSGVFISYARADGEGFANALRERLSRAAPDVRLWQDRPEIEGGVGWWRQIEEALERVEFMVIVMTPGVLASDVTRKEWRAARQSGVCVFPVAGPGFRFDDPRLPGWMKRAHVYDVDAQWATFVAHLRRGCRTTHIPFMAPPLPAGFVARLREFGAVRSLVLDPKTGDTVAITTALAGAGGFGKTTLATALCHDDDVVTAFDDGVLWATLGQTPNVQGELTRLYAALTGERPGFVSIEDASQALAEKLEHKHCLIVIDDVWDVAHLQPFLRGGPNCARVLTTRQAQVATEGERINVDEMTSQEAVALLLARVGAPPSDLPPFRKLAHRLGEWPLLLKLAGSALRQRLDRGDSLEGALRYVDRALEKRGVTAFDRDRPTDRHEAVASTLGMSLDLLDAADRQRCAELAVFPEDVPLPAVVVGELWGLDDLDAEEALSRLHDASLIEFDLGTGTVRIHDVMRACFAAQLGSETASAHARLLKAWPDLHRLPHRYAWRWLAYHLREAGRAEDLRALLLDLDWLQRKLDATDIYALLADFAFVPEDPRLQMLHNVLRLSSHVLARDRKQLATQLMGRIPDRERDLQMIFRRQVPPSGDAWAREGNAALDPSAAMLRPIVPSLVGPGGALMRTLESPGVPARVAVTPDGQWIVSATVEGVISIWDLASGSLVRTAEADELEREAIKHAYVAGRIVSRIASRSIGLGVCFTLMPDEQMLVLSGRSLLLWDAAAGGEPRLLASVEDGVGTLSIAVSPDGRRALLGSRKGVLRLLDVQSGEELARPVAHRISVQTGESITQSVAHRLGIAAVAFTGDGLLGLTGSWDKTVRVWDLQTNALVDTLYPPHEGIVYTVAAARDAAVALSGSGDRTIRVWDLHTMTSRATLEGHTHRVYDVALSRDGSRALSGSHDRTLRLWDVSAGTPLATLHGHSDAILAVAFAPDEQHAVSAAKDGTVRLWQLDARESRASTQEHEGWIQSVAVTRDGLLAITGGQDHRLRVWETSTGQVRQVLRGHEDAVSALALHPDKPIVVSGSFDRTVGVWDLKTGVRLHTLTGHADSIAALAMGPAGVHFLSASLDGDVILWDIQRARIVKRWVAHRRNITFLAALPDFSVAITGSLDGTIKVWDIATQQCLQSLHAHLDGVTAGAIAPAADYLISGGSDGTIRLWRFPSCEVVQAVEGHRAKVRTLCFARQGRYAVSSSYDRYVKIWTIPELTIKGAFAADSAIAATAVSENGDVIVAGDGQGCAHFLRFDGG